VAPELPLGREVRVGLEQLGPPPLQLGGAAQLGVDERVPEARVVVVVAGSLGGCSSFLESPRHEVDVASRARQSPSGQAPPPAVPPPRPRRTWPRGRLHGPRPKHTPTPARPMPAPGLGPHAPPAPAGGWRWRPSPWFGGRSRVGPPGTARKPTDLSAGPDERPYSRPREWRRHHRCGLPPARRSRSARRRSRRRAGPSARTKHVCRCRRRSAGPSPGSGRPAAGSISALPISRTSAALPL
jgi:hypothetical protein